MLTGYLLLTLAAPYQPLVTAPPPEGWSIGQGGAFETNDYQDDAGVPASQVRLEFRRDDAGYGGMEETLPYARYLSTGLSFAPPEGARWCLRVSHLNTLNQSSPPSSELCFRTDWTRPTSPAFVDAGAIVSTGRVALEVQPATDTPSGVRSYFLEVAPTPLGDYQGFPDPEMSLPIVAFLGEGSWYGWVRVTDFAGNTNRQMLADYAVPISITANPAVPVPEAPRFQATMVNSYGSVLEWDAGWMVDAGITHVVSSFCYLSDAGCQWEVGFHSTPVTVGAGRWLQVSGEGTVVARLAVVQGGEVGPWSAASPRLLVDRTPPPVPPGLVALPVLSRAGPITLSWLPVVDDLTGLRATGLEETEQLSGVTRQLAALAPAVTLVVTPSGDGVYRYRAASVDFVDNQSAWSNTADVVVDGTGPLSRAPVAQASAVDGGALVSLSWSLPTDLLSGVASEELQERNDDGGTQLVSVTGLGASRLVPPGTWRWALRGNDVAGNVGAFSPPSNAIVVTAAGVAIGPAIVTTSAPASCGVPLALALQGTGDAPLQWALVSGPAGLAVDAQGRLSWTPSSAGVEPVQVRLSNGAGQVTGTIQVTVSCSAAPDAGTPPHFQTLGVGCGCSSLEGTLILLALGLLRRR